MEQQIRFCTTPDGVRLAYATVGKGPPLVRAAHWLSHLQSDQDSPIWHHWTHELSQSHLYARYDQRGCGLSDWDVRDNSFEAWVHDLETVTSSLRLDKFILLGIDMGGAVSIAYTARHPEKVSKLILYGAYARGWRKRNSPQQEVAEIEARLTLMKKGWGQEDPTRNILASGFRPDATSEQNRWFNQLQRVYTSPENAVRSMNEFGNIDIHHLLPKISVPTIILHAREDIVVPFEQGRDLAGLIPNSRFVPLEGRNHIMLEEDPTWKKFLVEVGNFLGVKMLPPEAPARTKETGLKSWLRGPRTN